MDWARDRGFAVVTLDADFHTLLMVSGAVGPSVVRLRLLKGVLERFSAELERGSMITAKAKKMTCHRLPVGGGR
jgi:predicted nuclease of predicted toxin-antitoxin system